MATNGVSHSAWGTRYAVLGAWSSNSPKDTIAFLLQEGKEQIEDEPKAPGWTVLGTAENDPQKVDAAFLIE